MRIGLDLDETITAMPALFSLLSNALLAAGHEVHIVTYRWADENGESAETRQELEKLGIRYTELHLPHRMEDAPEWKARIAAQVGLSVMIDDSPEVLAALPEGVKRVWICDPDVFDLDRCIRALQE